MESRKKLIELGRENCANGVNLAVKHKNHPDPAIKELAEALHLIGYGAQQIALALTEAHRINDLPGQS